MKRKDGHQGKTVREQGRYPMRPSSSLNDETRRRVEEYPGHLSQAWSSPSDNFGPQRKQGTFWRSRSTKKPARQDRSKIETRRQDRRPPRLSVDQAEENNQFRSRRNDWKDFLTTSEPPTKMSETLRKKRTLKNVVEPSSNCPDQTRMRGQSKQISKVLEYTV